VEVNSLQPLFVDGANVLPAWLERRDLAQRVQRRQKTKAKDMHRKNAQLGGAATKVQASEFFATKRHEKSGDSDWNLPRPYKGNGSPRRSPGNSRAFSWPKPVWSSVGNPRENEQFANPVVEESQKP